MRTWTSSASIGPASAIASDFGRKPAAIRSRLKKHGLV